VKNSLLAPVLCGWLLLLGPARTLSEISGEVDVRYGFGTRLETSTEASLQLSAGYETKLADRLWFVGSGRVRFDPVDDL